MRPAGEDVVRIEMIAGLEIAIRMEQVRQNCMTINGWKKVTVARTKVVVDQKTGKRKTVTVKGGGTGEICQRRPALCGE